MTFRIPDGFKILAATIAGAIAGGFVWSAVDGSIKLNGLGILRRQGPPLDQPLLFAAAGAVIVGGAAAGRFARDRALHRELALVAADLGLTYDEPDDGIRPGIPLFSEWRDRRNRMTGRVDGRPAEMFDLVRVHTGGDSSSATFWTVALFREVDLPGFDCSSRSVLTALRGLIQAGMDFDPDTGPAVEAFGRSHVLTPIPAEAEDEVRRHMVEPRLAALAGIGKRLVQSGDGVLAVAAKGTLAASDRAEFWRGAVELRRALLAPATPAWRPVPPREGMDLERRDHRTVGRRLGGSAGAAAGFFGAFVVFAAAMMASDQLKAGGGSVVWLLAAFPFVMISGLAGGATLGAWIGGRVSDRSFRPGLAKLAPVSHAWGGVGAFLGWIAGAAVGVALFLRVVPVIGAKWAIPFVFFTPAIVGLVGGGLVGARFGRIWTDRRAGGGFAEKPPSPDGGSADP